MYSVTHEFIRKLVDIVEMILKKLTITQFENGRKIALQIIYLIRKF